MRFLESFRKRRAIKAYALRLPRLLVRDYGFSKSYKPTQVRRTIERYNLNIVYSCYGLAMFSGRDDFNQFHDDIVATCDYDSMRAEIASEHFNGNTEFTFSDIVSAFSESAADFEHGGSHDTGGHDVGGGDGHSHGGH